MKYSILFLLTLTQLAKADDLSLTFHLEPGEYYTSGKSTLVSHHLRLKRWGNEIFGEGSYLYGERRLPFRVKFTRTEKNIFDGKGEIEVWTPERVECKYPTRVTIVAYQEKIFVKDLSPTRYPESLGPDGKCPAAGQPEWVLHDEPYYRWPNE